MLAVRVRSGRQVSIVTGSLVVLVSLQFASAMAMVVVAALAAPRGDLWPGVIVLTLAMVAMTAPDSEVGLLALLAYGGWWVIADREASWGAALVAAVAALAFHLTLAHAAAAPAGATTSSSAISALVVDAGLVVAATTLATLLLAAIRGSGLHAPAFVIGIGLILIGGLPWISALNRDWR